MKRLLSRMAVAFFDLAMRYHGIGRFVSALVISPRKSKTFVLERGMTITVNIPNNQIHGYLVDGLSANERATLNWIRDRLQDGHVFYNIGANFGFYVLAANQYFKLGQTVAFEPEALNFAELCTNIHLNGLRNVVALPIAVLDRAGFDDFFISSFAAGNASGKSETYATETNISDPTYFVQGYKQKIVCQPLDAVIEDAGLRPPNLILMDIDGGEALALQGMKKTLQNSSLRALVVEVAEETSESVRRELGAQGFNLVHERTQRRGNEFFLRDDSG